MASYGKSYGASTTPTTEETVATQGTLIKFLADQLKWFRGKFAALMDNEVEPDDIELDDELRNLEH